METKLIIFIVQIILFVGITFFLIKKIKKMIKELKEDKKEKKDN